MSNCFTINQLVERKNYFKETNFCPHEKSCGTEIVCLHDFSIFKGVESVFDVMELEDEERIKLLKVEDSQMAVCLV